MGLTLYVRQMKTPSRECNHVVRYGDNLGGVFAWRGPCLFTGRGQADGPLRTEERNVGDVGDAERLDAGVAAVRAVGQLLRHISIRFFAYNSSLTTKSANSI
ncbi:hypothetical protein D3C76_530690 [compost metagenome]